MLSATSKPSPTANLAGVWKGDPLLHVLWSARPPRDPPPRSCCRPALGHFNALRRFARAWPRLFDGVEDVQRRDGSLRACFRTMRASYDHRGQQQGRYVHFQGVSSVLRSAFVDLSRACGVRTRSQLLIVGYASCVFWLAASLPSAQPPIRDGHWLDHLFTSVSAVSTTDW